MKFSKKCKKRLLFSFIILSIVFFFACKTTSVKGPQITDYSFEDENDDEDTKFIFLRLYDPKYKNPFEISNFLKNCINLIEVNPISISHSSIGFDLHDSNNFFGLSLGGEKAFKFEECEKTEDNVYMKKCNTFSSTQTTFALRVSNKEYEDAKLLVEYYTNFPELRYATGQNFSIAMYSIHRKFALKPENQKLGSEKLAKNNYSEAEFNFDPTKTDFVCSTLIAYILYTTVDSVHDFFVENQIDIMKVTPSDLATIPGVERLFSSTWDNYIATAENFVNNHQEFSQYYSDLTIAQTDSQN